MRTRTNPMTSTRLWRQVLTDRRANTLEQRLRRKLRHFLQLAALAALAFALTRPFVFTTPGLRGSLIVSTGSIYLSSKEKTVDVFCLIGRSQVPRINTTRLN